MNLILFAQQLPPRSEAFTVLAIVVGALLLFAASVWYLSYSSEQVRFVARRRPSTVHPFVRPMERAGLEALTEAPRKIRAAGENGRVR